MSYLQNSDTTGRNSSYGKQSCGSCKQSKRKCDRLLPHCSECTRKKLRCIYSHHKHSNVLPDTHSGNPHGAEISNSGLWVEQSGFPAVYFLDPDVFRSDELEIPNPLLSVPSSLKALIGDLHTVGKDADNFFETIHSWMPIISKVHFYKQVLNPLAVLRADAFLLLLCMKLAIWAPCSESQNPRNEGYMAAKRLFVELEMVGIFSLQTLQALILLAVYEIGHAIYPSAYLTIGACARYGTALGINRDISSVRHDPATWIKDEEKRRAWWAILMLDRIVNLNDPTRSLATDEPKSTDILPIDDDEWNQGIELPSQLHTLSSLTALRMGRFARMAQATYLLSLALKRSSPSNVDMDFQIEEALQLYRTICSLISLTDVEGRVRHSEVCPANNICYCALLMLRLPNNPHESGIAYKKYDLKSDAELVWSAGTAMGKALLFPNARSPDSLSPFILHVLYQTTLVTAKRYHECKSQSLLEDLENNKNAFLRIGKKWKAAYAYLEIIQAKEFAQSYAH